MQYPPLTNAPAPMIDITNPDALGVPKTEPSYEAAHRRLQQQVWAGRIGSGSSSLRSDLNPRTASVYLNCRCARVVGVFETSLVPRCRSIRPAAPKCAVSSSVRCAARSGLHASSLARDLVGAQQAQGGAPKSAAQIARGVVQGITDTSSAFALPRCLNIARGGTIFSGHNGRPKRSQRWRADQCRQAGKDLRMSRLSGKRLYAAPPAYGAGVWACRRSDHSCGGRKGTRFGLLPGAGFPG